MSVTGSSNMTSLATASPLAALSGLDDPVATSSPAGMNRNHTVLRRQRDDDGNEYNAIHNN